MHWWYPKEGEKGLITLGDEGVESWEVVLS